MTLDLNDTLNDANGNIVLGIWNAGTFTRWNPLNLLEANQVNAVRCQIQTTIPTSFLRLLGINTLPVAANAIAVSNPPALPGLRHADPAHRGDPLRVLRCGNRTVQQQQWLRHRPDLDLEQPDLRQLGGQLAVLQLRGLGQSGRHQLDQR